MQVVTIIAKTYHISPFEVLDADIDDFARLVNYLVEEGQDTPTETGIKTKNKNSEQRIRVNDKTATGGWF